MSGTSLHNEKELLGRIALGDEQAFAQIFHHYRNKIFTVAFRLTVSYVMAEEIMQDVFLKIWMKREMLPSLENFDAFLFITARNHTIDAMRRIAAHKIDITQLQPEFGHLPPASDELLLEKQFHALLQQAVEQLPSQQRTVYRLSKEQELKREEIAEQMGIAPQTVKIHLAKAMKFIRAWCLARMEWCMLPFIVCALLGF